LSGVLQIFPFPIAGPTPLWRTAFCWIALLPLFAALTRLGKDGKPITLMQGALLGYACGFVWYLGNCYWVYQTMYLYGGLAKPIAAGILVLFCLYLGLYHALFATLIVVFRRSRLGVQGALLLAPFAWVAVELARARITGFPWDLLGIAQIDNRLLTRLAPFAGAYGLSFVIAAVNALWLVRISVRERRHTRTVLTAAGVMIVVAYLLALRHLEMPLDSPVTATATLVQHNLGVGTEANSTNESVPQLAHSFIGLSLHPGRIVCHGIPELSSTHCVHDADEPLVNPDGGPALPRTDLIVWPESPANFQERDSAFNQSMSALARLEHAPIIVGDLGVDNDSSVKRGYRLYNSANVIAADGSFLGRYDKMHLVPFGEYVPFKQLFFFAGDLLGEAGNFDAGTHRAVFTTGGHTYGTFICYESVFGDEVRQFVNNGADVLVNISNDGWYGDTSAAWEHLAMVRMRAIENHRWILRSTNTGVTAAINPYGRVTASMPRHIRSSVDVAFGYENDITFYAAHGDLFAYACALVTTLALGFSLTRKML
jgi:apolipoprotein N-acyltransferase